MTKESTKSDVLFQSGAGSLHGNDSLKERTVSHLLCSLLETVQIKFLLSFARPQ